MPGIHTEGAFENSIEAHLLAHGYIQGRVDDYDHAFAIDLVQLFGFIEDTQPEEWGRLQRQHGADVRSRFLKRLTTELAARGSLDVFRRGVKDMGVTVRLAYFKPTSSAGPELVERYERNRLSVVRQLPYDAGHAKTLDLTIFLNGIPLVTTELKNPISGQTVEHAVKQYCFDRHPADQIFRYTERALVHFAVDADEVQMTTRLEGSDTSFLPFNRGRDGGAGNPDNPTGYRTAYLWEDIWARDSLLDIVQRFIDIEYPDDVGAKKHPKKGRLIFPRYHQIDVVRQLEAASRAAGTGNNYLVMHSTGSGKSLSIAWTAHRLFSLHDANDERIFHSVIVVTDRVVLDQQLQNTIYGIDHKHGVVETIEGGIKSEKLAVALERGAPIIVVTLQTFPFVMDKLGELGARNYAVIVDEAHSSQTGTSAAGMKKILAASSLEEAEEEDEAGQAVDLEDELLRMVADRGPQPNLSYLAFTATPKPKTLEMFGTQGTDGKFRPFHVYPMRQAIEEGFIMDVLSHYTTYERFFKLAKTIEEDPAFESRQAAKAIARFVELHPHNIAQKVDVIVDHFRKAVRPRIGGKAKAMVVTGSRLHAVRYYFALRKRLQELGVDDVGVLVAFSGTVRDPGTGLDYTEPALNGFSETKLPKHFDGPMYQILVVAEKYQTGFDQPLLHTMYVDKKLAGVHAVQTLGRLNRTAPGKEDTFVLDFVNREEDILQAFKPYYEEAVLASATDPNLLYDLERALRDSGIFYDEEVDGFVEVLLKPVNEPGDPGLLNSIVDKAVNRFTEENEQGQETFRKTLGQFNRLYAFLSHVVTFQDIELDKLFLYGRWLFRKLPAGAGHPVLELDDDVALQAYRIEKKFEGKIDLGAKEGEELKPITAVGTRLTPEQFLRLSELIEAINERFGLNLTDADVLFFEQVGQDMMADGHLETQAKANPKDSFKIVFEEAFLGKVLNRKDRNEEMLKMVLDSPDFAQLIKDQMLPWVYEGLKQRKTVPQLIEEGENEMVEFKSSARWSHKAAQPSKDIEDAVVKTVAAFVNSEGGTLLIGLDDDGAVLGLEPDLGQVKGGDLDAYENWLMGSLLQNALGKAAASLVNVSFAEMNGGTICRLDVQPSPSPVFAKMSKATDVFWARLGNTTQELTGNDLLRYIQQRWKGAA
jgi:type I restriction enzyme R subunit